MLDTVKNCDVSTRAIQVLFRWFHLVRQTLLNERFKSRLFQTENRDKIPIYGHWIYKLSLSVLIFIEWDAKN